MAKVLYLRSLDLITKGHMSMINYAYSLFEEVIVAVLVNLSKKTYAYSFLVRN